MTPIFISLESYTPQKGVVSLATFWKTYPLCIVNGSYISFIFRQNIMLKRF